MKKRLVFIMSILMMFLAIGCTQDKEAVITMGFVPMRDGDKLIESVEPLTEILSEELGKKSRRIYCYQLCRCNRRIRIWTS